MESKLTYTQLDNGSWQFEVEHDGGRIDWRIFAYDFGTDNADARSREMFDALVSDPELSGAVSCSRTTDANDPGKRWCVVAVTSKLDLIDDPRFAALGAELLELTPPQVEAFVMRRVTKLAEMEPGDPESVLLHSDTGLARIDRRYGLVGAWEDS